MDSSLGIKLVGSPKQSHQQQLHPEQQPQQAQPISQHPFLNNTINNCTSGDSVLPNSDRVAPFALQRRNAATTITSTQTPTTPHPPQPISSINAPTIITRPATVITSTTQNVTSAPSTNTNQTSSAERTSKNITTEDLNTFFERKLYNECQAVEELIRSIDASQNEKLARMALNLFQKHYTSLERPWDHETFMYGLGLIYMHFNAYNWAVKSFRDTIYVEPGYMRSRDIHTRLGLIFKTTGRYKLSEKHFNLAIDDRRPESGISTRSELRFQLAHLYEIQGRTDQAIELYENLLQERDLSPKLSANINRQLGWIYYLAATKSGSSARNESRLKNDGPPIQTMSTDTRKLDAALNYLNTSYKTENDSQTSYCLGRCLTHAGKLQDAFAFYRSVIDKEESTADTWCSIGVLYQHQNQPWDALQAYIRSVQYDKKHGVAWMNLGILYESHNQFKDALKCYQHVSRSNLSENIDKSLQNRVIYIQKHIDDIESASNSNNGKSDKSSDKLLSLEDLWNMESKTNQESSASSSNSNKSDTSQNSALQQNINPRVSNRLVESGSTDRNSNPQNKSITFNDKSNNNHIALSGVCQANETNQPCNGRTMHSSFTCRVKSDVTSEDDKIEANHHEADSKQYRALQQNSTQSNPPPYNGLPVGHRSIEEQILHDFKPKSLDAKEICLNQIFTNGASKDSGISSDSSIYTDCALVPSQHVDSCTDNYLPAEKVIESCKNSTRVKRIDINLLSDDTKPPSTFPRCPIYPPLPSEKLFPLPPSIFLDSKKELNSKKLQDICQSNPISIVRNIASVLKLDLGLFSTKTLVEIHPDKEIDIVSHLWQQNIDGFSTDEISRPSLWTCERKRSLSTLSHYANYQVDSFRQSIQEDRDSKTKPNSNKESETDSNESAIAKKIGESSNSSKLNDSQFNSSGPSSKRLKKEGIRTKVVKSAFMIDISDEQKWRPQLNELNKLPYFFKCVSAANMLTHIGVAVPRLNTNTLSMHVPGCRMLGNKTPNNFCHININIGPGDYEWSAIPGEYEGVLKKLCNRNGFELQEDDWWPRIADLHKYHIPIYRFSQRPGDLVWVNSSTFYWVQATGWANNLQWNIGPLSSRQYRLAAESCEFDKLIFRKSEVPLVQMTWNMVMNINIINDDELFSQMVNVLKRSLRYCQIVLDIVDSLKVDVNIATGETGPKSGRFCCLCECEVFNITFTKKQSEATHCIECARRSNAINEYRIDQHYSLTFLMKLYDKFIDTKLKYQARQRQIFMQEQRFQS